MYIAIAGNIGSGKSCLAELLGERLGWKQYSDQNGNPYIEDFYNDMRRWSLNLQMYFLGQRLNRITTILANGENAIIDRTIYEDAEVFALNLHRENLLSSRDFNSYLSLYDFTARHLTPPDILIYLRASADTLVKQIKQRGRPYEASIQKEYLQQLNGLYEDWIAGYKDNLMVIDVDNEDFINNMTVREKVVSKIEKMINERK